jgi:hypothetical protein
MRLVEHRVECITGMGFAGHAFLAAKPPEVPTFPDAIGQQDAN